MAPQSGPCTMTPEAAAERGDPTWRAAIEDAGKGATLAAIESRGEGCLTSCPPALLLGRLPRFSTWLSISAFCLFVMVLLCNPPLTQKRRRTGTFRMLLGPFIRQDCWSWRRGGSNMLCHPIGAICLLVGKEFSGGAGEVKKSPGSEFGLP